MMFLALFGCVILVVSLLAANKLTAVNTSNANMKLYFGRPMLPDHIFYPVARVGDRLAMETAAPEEQVDLSLQFADHRYEMAERLLQRNQPKLAVTTMTKSQKYVLSAGYQAVDMDFSVEKLTQVREAIDRSLSRVDSFIGKTSDVDPSALSQLRQDTVILLTRIDEKIAKINPPLEDSSEQNLN